MMVYKDYDLPKYVNQHTLVIISSYSGNTEETIHMMKQALRNKAIVVSISSGGQTAELAKKKKIPYVLVP
jgi:glucose/mannose-6-phosphate isomerase